MMFEALSKGIYIPGAYEVFMQGMRGYPWLLLLATVTVLVIAGIFMVWAKKARKL